MLCLGAASAPLACDSLDTPSSSTAPTEVFIVDGNNYQSTASLSIPTTETATATDLEICWESIDSDLKCHDVEPDLDVGNVTLLRLLDLSKSDVEDRLSSGQLSQSNLDGYLDFEPADGTRCTQLSSFTLRGSAVDIEQEYTDEADHTYLLLFANGTVPGVGALSMLFLDPSSNSSNTRVDGVPGCGLLDFSADLSSVEPIELSPTGPWVLDWSELTRDGLGNDFAFERVDHILLAFYEDATIAELESEIMDLELIATLRWDIEYSGGHSVDLTQGVRRDTGDPFAGFPNPNSGIWLLGLMCGTCQNPAPLLLSVLDPVGGHT